MALPLSAFLANKFGEGEGDMNPWCTFYASLIYLTVIPGIFSILLTFYHLLIEKKSIYDINIMVHILPIISMGITLFLIKQNVKFDQIPGFGKLTAFASTMAGLMVVFYFLDKTRIIAFTYIPFLWVILLLIIIYLAARYGMKWLLKN